MITIIIITSLILANIFPRGRTNGNVLCDGDK